MSFLRIFLLSILLLIFFQKSVFAGFGRSTTFDNREICEKEKGVWREFGNSFADNCEPKFDRYMIAAQSLVFSCDCGPQKCWNDNKCLSMQEYEKIFIAEKEAQAKKIAKQREEREQEAIFFANEKIRKYYQEKPATLDNQRQNQNQTPNQTNNINQFRDKIISAPQPIVNNVIQNANNNNLNPNNFNAQQIQDNAAENIKSAVQRVQSEAEQINTSPISKILTPKEQQEKKQAEEKITNSENNSDENNPNSQAGPTPFFLQQQENEKKLQAEKLKEEQKKLQEEQNKNQKNQGNNSLPELPQIPLPQ